jgi:protoporphyrinogen oxidase
MGEWDVIVLGGGIAGLAAAYEFGKLGKRALVLEKSAETGGALHATKVKSFFVDDYYHHLFPRDIRTLRACRELNIPIDWKRVTTAFFDKGQFYRLTAPQDLLFFKPLSFRNKLALARLMFRVTRISSEDIRRYDLITAKDFLVQNSNEQTYKKFFEPLLQSKFGADLGRISAAWLIERLQLRSDRSVRGETLGYVRGGFHKLTAALMQAIAQAGGKVQCAATIRRVRQERTGWTVTYNKEAASAPVLVSTLPPRATSQLVAFPDYYSRKLDALEYQGACCVLVGLEQPLTPHYWTNILEPASFGAVIEQTKFVNPKNYEGNHLVYLASYPDKKLPLWGWSNEDIAAKYIADMNRLFGDQNVLWHKVFRLPAAGLVYSAGIRKNIVPVTTPLPGLFVAGQFNSYPERSIDRSFALAQEIVRNARPLF